MNKKIEFKQVKGTNLFAATTERGNAITYGFVREERLVLFGKREDLDTEAEKPNGAKDWIEKKQPTKMRFESTFRFTGEMLDLMTSSKIMEVLGCISHDETSTYEVTYFPRLGFDYEKLQDVIVDILEKYNL